jgi:cell division protein CrgA
MPDRTSRRGGRVTPPKTATSGRYTPPIPRSVRVSPMWVPILMGALLVVGALMIILNYLELLPGAASNWYLLAGLGCITAGFVTATQWH